VVDFDSMSISYPVLSAGLTDKPVGGRRPGDSHRTKPNPAAHAMSIQSTGDRLLAEVYDSKCSLLRLVHRFIQEYIAQVRHQGPDLFIKTCNYRQRPTPRGIFDSGRVCLHPHMEWTALHLAQHSDPTDARVFLILQPYVPDAVVTLPQILTQSSPVDMPPTIGYTADDGSNLMRVGAMEYALCDPLTLVATIVCNGAAVDRSMRPSEMHELSTKAQAARKASKSAGVFYHALMQEPTCDWQSVDEACSATEYLSKTSEGVKTVMYNAGEGEREHPFTRGLVPAIAMALREVHLSMDELFSVSDPPRWPMVLAFMQLCKPGVSTQMVTKAKAVIEAYRNARITQHDFEDRFLCADYISEYANGTPAYNKLQEYQQEGLFVGSGDGLDDESQFLIMDDSLRVRHGANGGGAPPRRRIREEYGGSNKPQCAVC
jgi:hypothetical protein